MKSVIQMSIVEININIGWDTIDFQHQILLTRMKELIEAIKENQEKCIIEYLIKDIAEYSFYHLQCEENIFKDINYDNKEKHLKEHNHFREMLLTLIKAYTMNYDILFENVEMLFKEWIEKHIFGTDLDLINYLKENGNI